MKKLRAADLFCGAGGTTTGAEASGFVDVVLAVNHWRTAIQTHRENHPQTRHICARIDDIDPRHDSSLPEIDLLMASPECTHHSIARGGRPIDDQKRATPWHVCVWAEAKRPAWIVIENVREFRDWGPLDAKCRPIRAQKGEIYRQWIKSLEAIGYQVDAQILNAADFGAATKRHRLFIVGRLKHSRKDIPWPDPTHAGNWKPAYEVIDWSRSCPSIFTRKRPLAEKTLRRIEIGLRKFVGPYVVTLRNNQAAEDLGQPVSTICTSGAHHGLAVPFLVPHFGERQGQTPRTHDLSKPIPTVTGQGGGSVAMPFFLPRAGYHDAHQPDKPPPRSVQDPLPTIIAGDTPGAVVMPFQFKAIGRSPGVSKSIHEPVPTILAARENHAVIVPYLLAINHGGDDDRSRSPDDPLGTLTTKTGHSLVLPFLTKYYGTGGAQPVTDPLDTITSHDRFGLAMASLIQTMKELQVVDIGFRMLDVDELARAQGFPDGYMLFGSKAEQVKQVGNAVCPPVAEAICRAIGQAA